MTMPVDPGVLDASVVACAVDVDAPQQEAARFTGTASYPEGGEGRGGRLCLTSVT
jgi:hypothetical protein